MPLSKNGRVWLGRWWDYHQQHSGIVARVQAVSPKGFLLKDTGLLPMLTLFYFKYGMATEGGCWIIWYPSKTHLKLRGREILLFVDNTHCTCHIVWHLTRSMTLTRTIQNDWATNNMLWVNEISRHLCLTHLTLVPHKCVSKSGQHWFR